MSEEAAEAKKRGLRRFILDNAIVFVAQALQKLRGLITLPLLVQGLGTAAYGAWAQFLAFTGLVAAVFGLSLHLPLVRTIAADRSRAAVVHSTLLLATIVIGALLATPFLLGLPDAWSKVLVGSGDRTFLFAALAVIVFGNVRLIAMNVYRATDRIAVRSVLELAASAVEVGGVVVLLVTGHGLSTVVTWCACSAALVALLAGGHALWITGVARPSMKVLWDALRYSLPLLPATLAMWALDRGDRFVLSTLRGQTELGAYAAHYAVASLVLFVLAPLQVTLVPKMSALWDSDRPQAMRFAQGSFRLLSVLVVPFVVGLPIIAPELFRALANEEVAAQARVSTALLALGLACWSLSIVVSMLFYASGRTRTVAAVTAASAAVNIGLNLLLVPSLGSVGSGIATAVGYGLALVIFVLQAFRHTQFDLDLLHLLKCVCASLIMALALIALRAWATKHPVVGALVAIAVHFLVLVLLGGVRRELAVLRDFRAPSKRAVAPSGGGGQ